MRKSNDKRWRIKKQLKRILVLQPESLQAMVVIIAFRQPPRFRKKVENERADLIDVGLQGRIRTDIVPEEPLQECEAQVELLSGGPRPHSRNMGEAAHKFSFIGSLETGSKPRPPPPLPPPPPPPLLLLLLLLLCMPGFG